MKLQAVTVCINYADFLECILPNREHFDRWVIMTVPCDAKTIALCQRYGLEYRLSRTLLPDGSDFHATLNKSSIVNEGLDALDPTGWALIVDADVRLPRHFRTRLKDLPLQCGALYGAAGRKVCEEREMFEMLVRCEPWDRFCARYSGVIGFFQLFHLEHSVNRYLPSNAPGTGPGDDDQFQILFPPELRRFLPLTVIHVGRPYLNWAGRIDVPFSTGACLETHGVNDMPPCERGRAVFIGYFPGSTPTTWFSHFEQVYLLDHFHIDQHSSSEMIESDRRTLRLLWDMSTSALGNVRKLGIHSTSSLAEIPDRSVDLLYLSGETTPDWLTAAAPIWEQKLRPGSVICGDLYGLPHWPDSTQAVSMLFGIPDDVRPNGFWSRQLSGALTNKVNESEYASQALELPSTFGVVFVFADGLDLAELLVSLHSLRKHWSGPVTVYQWGASSPSLSITCARYSVDLQSVGNGFTTEAGTYPELVWEATSVAPYERALFLPVGTLVVGDIENSSLASNEYAQEMPTNPHTVIHTPNGRHRYAVKFTSPQLHLAKTHVTPIIVCSGLKSTWSSSVWDLWCVYEAAMITALSCRVRVQKSMRVVTIVDKRTVAAFERCWLTWEFPTSTPVWIVLDGLDETDIWLADNRRPTGFIMAGNQASSTLSKADLRGPLAFIAPSSFPLPGAELRIPGFEDVDGVWLSQHADVGKDVDTEYECQNAPLFGFSSRDAFHEALQDANNDGSSISPLSERVQALLLRKYSVQAISPASLGWNIASIREEIDDM